MTFDSIRRMSGIQSVFRQSEVRSEEMRGDLSLSVGVNELIPSHTYSHVPEMSYFNYPQHRSTSRAIRATPRSH